MLARAVHIWIPSIPDAPVAWTIALLILVGVPILLAWFFTRKRS